MTTLIVGCGYLGRRVGRRLAERGVRVVGTVRTASRAEELAGRRGIEPRILDVLDPASLDGLPDAERVLYCVGFDREAGADRRAVVVEGLRNVLGRLAGRVRRLVFAGTTGVYAQDDGGWVDEDSPTEPRQESGRVALEAESLVREYSARGSPPLILRLAGLYGPGRVIRREALARGEPIVGDPERYLNLVHIDDAARAAEAALMAEGVAGILNVADDRPRPRRRYYEFAASLLGGPRPRFVPPEPGHPAAGREEANRRIANGRMKAALGLSLAYPGLETGLPAAFDAERARD